MVIASVFLSLDPWSAFVLIVILIFTVFLFVAYKNRKLPPSDAP